MNLLRPLYFILLYFSCSQVFCANLSVKLSPASPGEGEAFNYIATITGVSGRPQVAIASLPQCNGWQGIQGNNPQLGQRIVNGNYSLTLTWQSRAKTKGTYPVTPLVLQINGKQVSSNKLTLHVTPVQTKDFYLFQSSLSTTKAYVGQSVDLHLDLLFADKEIQKYERTQGSAYEFAQTHYDPLNLKGSWTDHFHITPKVFRQVQGANLYAGVKASNVKIGEYFYRRHRLTFTLEPKQAGSMHIPALTQLFYKLQFRRAFIGVDAVRAPNPTRVSTKPLTLNVTPPPKDNQPSSFNGQVCENLSVELIVPDLTPGQEVQMHSPISLKLKVMGSIAPASIRSPNWKSQQALLSGFDVSSQSMIRDDEKDHTLFSEIVVRPKNAQLTEIPPLELSYFDPKQKKYKTIKTKPFVLKVQAIDESASLEDQPLALLDSKKTRTSETIGRIEGIEINQERLLQATQKTWPWVMIYLFTYLPLLGVAAFYCFGSLQQHQQNKSHAQRYQATGTLKTIQAAENSSAILEAVNRYINEKWKVTDPRRANLKAEVKPALESLLANLEAASYAPDCGDQSALKSQAIDLINSLDKETV